MDLLKVVEKHFIHSDDPARRLQREERRALNVAVRSAMEACASKAIGDPLAVIDFSNLDRNTPRNRARIVELDAPPHVAAASCSPNAKYFRISDIDGLYFISNCLTPQQQFDWSLRSVREFSNLPYTNLSNLHGEQPNHWKNAIESGSLDAFRTLRWANIGFSYNWSKREYVEFGRSDNTALPNSINAAANGAKFTDTSSSKILELESHFPPDLGALAAELAVACNMPMEVESGICNFYCTSSAHMGCHVDDAEHDLTKPVVGLSIACTGIFLLGGATRHDVPTAFYLRSGDAIVMGGESRLFFHGVPRIIAGDLPEWLREFDVAAEMFVRSPMRFCASNEPIVNTFAPLSDDEQIELRLLLEYLHECRLNLNMRQVRELEVLRAQAQQRLQEAQDEQCLTAQSSATVLPEKSASNHNLNPSMLPNRLHRAMLEHVLSFLPLSELLLSVASVSSLFRLITTSPSISTFSDINLRPFAQKIDDKILLQWLLPVVSQSKSLSLEDCAEISCPVLCSVLRNASCLQSLVLTDVGLAANDEAIQILNSCSSLQSLTVGYCESISDNGLAAVLRSPTCRLRNLILRGCRQLTLDFLCRPLDSCVEWSLPTLRHLELSHVRGIEPATYVALTRRLPHLESLNLWDCSGTSNDVLSSLAENCHFLSDLNIGGASAVDDDGLRYLTFSPCVKALRSITLYGVYNIQQQDTIVELLLATAMVTEASINSQKHRLSAVVSQLMSTSSRSKILSICQPFAAKSPMKIVNVDKLSHLVDDRLMLVISSLCGQLTQLHISGAHRVSEVALLQTLPLLSSLERLDAWGCFRALSDRSVSMLAQTLGSTLRELHVGNTLQITDDSLQAIADYCPRLRGFGLSCTSVTMRGILLLMHAPASAHMISHRVRIHLLGDPDAPLEWPPTTADVERCLAVIGSETEEAERIEQMQSDEHELEQRFDEFSD